MHYLFFASLENLEYLDARFSGFIKNLFDLQSTYKFDSVILRSVTVDKLSEDALEKTVCFTLKIFDLDNLIVLDIVRHLRDRSDGSMQIMSDGSKIIVFYEVI